MSTPAHSQQTPDEQADELVHAIRRGGYGHNITWAEAVELAAKVIRQRDEAREEIARSMDRISRKNAALRNALGFIQMCRPEDADDMQMMSQIEQMTGQIKASLNRTYLFYRDSGFYPIELEDDYAARENAALNPGTLRVENAETREVVWPLLNPKPTP